MKKYSSIIAKILLLFAWQMDAVSKLLHLDGYIEARIFFLILAVGLALLASEKIDNIFEFVFFEFALYNIVDEAMGNGSTYQWYEMFVFVGALLFAVIKRKRDGNRVV